MTASSKDMKRLGALVWIISLATIGLAFDGYDLVIYGTVVSTFLRDPTHIGAVDPALAGALGSYALLGVLVGALSAGGISDIVGRRIMMLASYAWFSIGMAATSFSHDANLFGALRFFTGIGIGALLATTGALVAEFAPKNKKNLCNAITYSGVPLGSLAAAAVAIALLGQIGWRGMFMIGAIPFFTLLPLAIWKMPESVAWLISRGRIEEARAVADRVGMDMPATDATTAQIEQGATGYRGLFSDFLIQVILIGMMSALGLFLVYGLNTWLPELMLRADFDTQGSLSFLLVLNGGAVVGAIVVALFSDRFGPKAPVAASFLLGAAAIFAMTLKLPLAALLVVVALVGVGTSGTQILIYGFVASSFPTRVRGAAVAWCAGFGRLGGVGGPLIGGFLIASGLSMEAIFFLLAALATVGAVITLVVPAGIAREKTASSLSRAV